MERPQGEPVGDDGEQQRVDEHVRAGLGQDRRGIRAHVLRGKAEPGIEALVGDAHNRVGDGGDEGEKRRGNAEQVTPTRPGQRGRDPAGHQDPLSHAQERFTPLDART